MEFSQLIVGSFRDIISEFEETARKEKDINGFFSPKGLKLIEILKENLTEPDSNDENKKVILIFVQTRLTAKYLAKCLDFSLKIRTEYVIGKGNASNKPNPLEETKLYDSDFTIKEFFENWLKSIDVT